MNNPRVEEISQNVCHSLEQAQNNDEQAAALELLRTEVKKDTSAMDPEQAKEYMFQLTQQLQDSKQLPVLSLVYAEQLAAENSESDVERTDVSRSDLRDEMRSVDRSLRFGENDKRLEKAMLRFLLDNYDDGIKLIETQDEESDYDSTISSADMTAKLAEYKGASKPVCK